MGGRPKEDTLHLRGGTLPKRVTGRRSDWTQKMGEQFVATLADTCNVALAAASIDRSIANVYKWRTKDAGFRAAWDRALAVGYSRLELMLLERALHGVEKVVVARDGSSSVMREYPSWCGGGAGVNMRSRVMRLATRSCCSTQQASCGSEWIAR